MGVSFFVYPAMECLYVPCLQKVHFLPTGVYQESLKVHVGVLHLFRAEELYPMLVCSISGNYGHIWLSPEEYRRKQASNQLTAQERQDFNEPGPFSIASYCEALLKSDFYGEELCLRLLSMMFKVCITVLDGDSLVGIRVRHQNAALNADAILIHISRCHYIAMGKSSFIVFFLLFSVVFVNHMQ